MAKVEKWSMIFGFPSESRHKNFVRHSPPHGAGLLNKKHSRVLQKIVKRERGNPVIAIFQLRSRADTKNIRYASPRWAGGGEEKSPLLETYTNLSNYDH